MQEQAKLFAQWVPSTSSEVKKAGIASRNIVIKNNIRCFKSALPQSLDFLFLVLYILADLISFLEIQVLQLAGSPSTVFVANLICNKQRFAYVANECSLQWLISICLINSIWLLSISFFLLAIFNDKATASRCILLFLDRLSEKMCTQQSRKVLWDMINTLFLTTVAVEPTYVAFSQHSKTHFHGLSCQFFQISLKNRELKTTHNAFRDCRVRFFQQPFSKQLYGKQGVLLPYQIRIHGSGTMFETGLYVSFFALNMLYCLLFDKGIMSVC